MVFVSWQWYWSLNRLTDPDSGKGQLRPERWYFEQDTTCPTLLQDSEDIYFLMIADIYISISMETFEHREYKSRGEDGNK